MSSWRILLRAHTSIFLFETNTNRVSYDLVAKQENLFCFFFCCRFLLEHRGNGLLTRATDISKSHVEVLFEEKGFSRESILRYFWTFIRPFEKTQENFLEKRFLKPFFYLTPACIFISEYFRNLCLLYRRSTNVHRRLTTEKNKTLLVKAHVWTPQDDDYTTQNSLFYTVNVNTSNSLPTIIPYYYFWDDGDVSGAYLRVSTTCSRFTVIIICIKLVENCDQHFSWKIVVMNF